MGKPWLGSTTLLQCNQGMVPAIFNVLPNHKVMASFLPIANIMDNKPFVNIVPFIICKSVLNPAVLALLITTGQQKGPCIPVIPAPWIPGNPMVQVGSFSSINMSSKLMCAYGGLISVIIPGQFTVLV